MANCKDGTCDRQYHELRNAETGEVFWIAVDDVVRDKPQELRSNTIKSLIISDEETEKVTNKSLLGDQKVTFQPKWGRIGMDGCRKLRSKKLTGLQYDVLMLLIESSKYGNKVHLGRDAIAEAVGASAAKVSVALQALESGDVITRIRSGCLMFNPDIVLVGESKFLKHWRDEYRIVRSERLSKKQGRQEKEVKKIPLLKLVA